MADLRRVIGASLLVAVLALPTIPRAAAAQEASPPASSAYAVDDVTPTLTSSPAGLAGGDDDLEPFTTIAATYRSATEEGGRVRVHTADGWSRWYRLSHAHAEAEGPLTSDPVWVGEADGYRIQVPDDATEVQVHLVRSTGAPVPVAPESVAAEAGGAPTVHLREAWGAAPYRGTVRLNASLRRGLVHHTVNSNSYSRAEVPEMLRSIQGFHQDGRGWPDLAYNFIVDRFGRIWEGRARSYEDPVIGSATSGPAEGNVTVAYLGDSSTYTPSVAVREAMGRLLGWKMRKHGLRPTRANIMGHRDVGETSCPGQALYRRISSIEDVAIVSPGPFLDVAWTNPRARAIDWADRNGIIPGFPDDRFRPGREATRADAAVWLWRLAGSPPGASEPFTDVAATDFFREAVEWGHGAGVLRGISATRYGPGRVITRQAFIDMLWRWLGSPRIAADHAYTDAGERESLDWAAQFGLVPGTRVRGAADLNRGMAADLLHRVRPFTDVGRRQVARAAVDWARAHVIVSGFRDHTFRAGDVVTRAQASGWLWRFLDRPDPGPVDPTPGTDPLDRATAAAWLWAAAGSPDAESAAAWAAAHGLFPGLTAPDFGTQPVTRAELVRALYRLAARPAAWATDPPGTVRF